MGTVGDMTLENMRAADIARVSYVYDVKSRCGVLWGCEVEDFG